MKLSLLLKPIADLTLSPELANLNITNITLDSRKVQSGALFFALAGSQDNGARYIDSAISRGASIVIAESCDPAEAITFSGGPVPVIHIPSLYRYISEIAGIFYDEPSRKIPVVGITGTNGKTTCSYLYAQLNSPCAMLGTLGHGIVNGNASPEFISTGLTTPDAVSAQQIIAQMVGDGAIELVMEVSSHALAQYRVAGVRISTAIFTNLSHDHLDYHGSFEQYEAAKAKLFEFYSVSKVVVNYDDRFGKILAHRLTKKQLLITYSLCNPQADFYLEGVTYHAQGSRGTIHSPFGSVLAETSLIGEFNWSNLLAVVAAKVTSSNELTAVAGPIKHLQAIKGRMEVVSQAPIHVLIDYAHTPDALEKALTSVALHYSGRVWCVFGCGGNRDQEKRAQMGRAVSHYADRLVVTSDNPRNEDPQSIIDQIIKGIPGQYDVEIDRKAAIEFAILNANDGDVVLVAGKGHELFQVVNDQKIPFSDHVCVQQALVKRGDNAQEAQL